MQNAALAIDHFSQRLDDYSRWRNELATAIQHYQEWYEQNEQLERNDSEEQLRLYELVDSLRSDKLTIALVGEFSRGKTELINSIFFSDYQRRLLPSTPGRTTMCPTEIMYDDKVDPCIRLLPIETRRSGITLDDHRRTPINWTTFSLNLDSADDMAEALRELERSKEVSVVEARELGLFNDVNAELLHGSTSGQVEIPVWRHALINYPHPLLRQGLVVLDTPGLNALGAEPELTLSLLSKAHAVLFVLAVDTGVTKTDLEVWKNHVCVATHNNPDSRIAALNKIDTLWDELHSDDEIGHFIHKQVEETRKLLDIGENAVFPVSAQKGLVGKIKRDANLVRKSGLVGLEEKLSKDIIACKQKLVKNKIVVEIGSVVKSSRDIANGKMAALNKELEELCKISNSSGEVIDDMAAKLFEQQKTYNHEVQNFQVTRRMLSTEVKTLLRHLSTSRLDNLISDSRGSMQSSWTTPGLRANMSTLFINAERALKAAEAQSRSICVMVDAIYDRFHKLFGLPKVKSVRFSVASFLLQFDRLNNEADAFRNSPTMLMTEQHFVIKKFFITLVSRARLIFQDADTSARNWAKAVLKPIHAQIQEHKNMIERRLTNLHRLRGNHTNLAIQVKETEAILEDLKEKSKMIDNILYHLES
ncbi:MAG: dynamin family protein [Gammaproteobacteria bacterium]|nr:dynamin family protein [Gammaproteobacteria bacterium]